MSESLPSAPSVDKQRALVVFSATLAAILIVFATVVASVNTTIYSAEAFVTRYLTALSNGDVEAALDSIDPTAIPSGDSQKALTGAALQPIDDVEIVSSTGTADRKSIVVAYTVAGVRRSTSFDVVREGNRGGLFPSWRFAAAPVATLSVRVTDAKTVSINNLTLPATSFISNYTVLTPMIYAVRHESTLLTSDTTDADYTGSSSTQLVHVAARANELFIDTVQHEVDDFLASCVAQQVLWPAGCPFGIDVDNRLVGLPSWSITQQPEITLRRVAENRWLIADSVGQASVSGTEQLISDGSTHDFTQVLDFSLNYVVVVDGEVVTIQRS